MHKIKKGQGKKEGGWNKNHQLGFFSFSFLSMSVLSPLETQYNSSNTFLLIGWLLVGLFVYKELAGMLWDYLGMSELSVRVVTWEVFYLFIYFIEG